VRLNIGKTAHLKDKVNTAQEETVPNMVLCLASSLSASAELLVNVVKLVVFITSVEILNGVEIELLERPKQGLMHGCVVCYIVLLSLLLFDSQQ